MNTNSAVLYLPALNYVLLSLTEPTRLQLFKSLEYNFHMVLEKQ